jgi:hypothetical protein
MGLAQFEPETKTLPLPGGGDNSVTLRGLSLDDLTALVSARMSELKTFYELYERSRLEIFATKRTDAFILMLVGRVPDLVAEVISMASTEAKDPAAREQARRLPFAFQAECLSEITRMTLVDAGGLGNLSAMLASLMKQALPNNESARELLASLKTETQAS